MEEQGRSLKGMVKFLLLLVVISQILYAQTGFLEVNGPPINEIVLRWESSESNVASDKELN